MPIDVRTVFCDDIRREDNGKAILIGVYTGDLIPSKLPGQFPISLWIDIRGLSAGSHEVKITIAFPGGDKLNLPGKIDVDEPDQPVSMMLAGLPASIKDAGLIVVEIEVGDYKTLAGQLIVRAPLEAAKSP